jgi:oligoendopeptidase F
MLSEYTPTSHIVPPGLDGARWEHLEPLYEELAKRELTCAKCLEGLILDRSDVDAAAAEAASVLYINMTCHTDDERANKAYLDHIENVQPKLKQAAFELDRRIAHSAFAAELDHDRYGVYLRNVANNVELFRAENIPLETELNRLDQEYSQIFGGMTVMFQGEERTIPQMSLFQELADRAVRESAWRTVAQRRSQDRERIADIYERMIDLRQQIAANAGFENYRDYMFRAKRRFEYGPGECEAYARGVEEVCVPALRRLQAERAELLGTEGKRLRPWDFYVDVRGRAPLRPFKNAGELVERTSRVFHRMDASLGAMFDTLRQGHCLDVETRKGKAPGGYQANRDWIRKPFIFMNAAGIQRDVETLLHEAGHSFHALLSRQDPLLAYRAEIPLEFGEVASMGMELTAHPFMDEYYPGDPDAADRARRFHLEQLAGLLPIVAVVDQFQHWIYTHKGHTRAERTRVWVELSRRFGGEVDWTGLEDFLDTSWHRILHLFSVPFYYIEYGIAQLGALQLWLNYRADPRAAITQYKSALALGGSRPIPDLYRACGLEFNMGPDMTRRLWAEVEKELAHLPG